MSSSCFGADICFHFSLFSELSTSYLFSFGGVAVVAKPVPDRVDREFYSAAVRAPDLKSWPRPMLWFDIWCTHKRCAKKGEKECKPLQWNPKPNLPMLQVNREVATAKYRVHIKSLPPVCGSSPHQSSTLTKGPVHMTSAEFSGFLTPSPPCLHFGPIPSTKFTQPPLLRPLLGKPPSPPPCGRT